MTPYSTGAVAKKRRGAAPVDTEDLLGEEGEGEGYGAGPEEEEGEDDSLEADTMIKVSPKPLMRFVVRKFVFGVSDQVQQKPGYRITEDG